MLRKMSVTGINSIPEIAEGDDIATIIHESAPAQGTPLESGDVVVVTQKIVSKAEGAIVDLREIEPSPIAQEFALKYSKDARLVELVLRESVRIVKMDRGVLIVETKHGLVCANAGIDASNIPGDHFVSLLPADPDKSAFKLRTELMAISGYPVAVIISDTFGRPWRMGNMDVAIGVSGIPALKDYRGSIDAHGYHLNASVAATADQIASAAELISGKLDAVPVVLVRGLIYSPDDQANARTLLRDPASDLFR